MQVNLSREEIKKVIEVSEIAQRKLESSLETWKQTFTAQRGTLTEQKKKAVNEKIEYIEKQIEIAIGVNGIFTQFLDEHKE